MIHKKLMEIFLALNILASHQLFANPCSLPCDTGAGGPAVKAAKKYQVAPTFCDEDSKEKQMDVDDEATSQASPALSDANMPAELPLLFKLALELAFSMFSFGLDIPTAGNEWWVMLTSGCTPPLSEDWCLHGMEWIGHKIFEHGYWKSGEERWMEVEILDVEEGGQLTDGIIEDEDDEEGGHSHGESLCGETSKRWNHLVHCAVSLSTVIDGFTCQVEGTHEWRVEGVLEAKREDDKNDSEEVKDLKALGNLVLAAASTDLLLQALKVLQIQIQKLAEENCTLHKENKVLVAEKPKCKHHAEAPNELLAHEQTITLYAHKYGMTIEMFPNSDLFSMQRPKNPMPFNSQDQYLMAMTQELVMKSISEAHSSEINKLHGIVGSIFDLPGVYFSNTQYHRVDIADIQKMLGVSATNPKYKTFLPVLFLGMQEDPTLKTVFGNWELLAKVDSEGRTSQCYFTSPRDHWWTKDQCQKWNLEHITPGSIAWAAVIAIFLLSPNTEFQKSGTGKSSSIKYKDLFFHYKKLLLTKPPHPDHSTQEDHSSKVICAMNALNIDSDNESDISEPTPTSSAVQSTTAFHSNTVNVA
ncbi:hypothetical protein EDD22DRAFT_1010860 [Suillus occidentalis]|nr:hypothetical protein EDD22DRAFT_1010860 [Suillus occidentalis]